jgi:hypothetical protein
MVIYQNSFYEFFGQPQLLTLKTTSNTSNIQCLIIPPFPPTKHEKLDSIKQKIIQLPSPPTDQALQKFRTMRRDLGPLLWPSNQKQTFSFTGALGGRASLYS